jgi:hypothetical protein
MGLAEYFAERDKDIPEPKYKYGDRVFVKETLEGVPIVGMVIREGEDKYVVIHADLPVMVGGLGRSIFLVPEKRVKRLKEL